MKLLTEHTWQLKYTPDDGDLVERFYVPLLACAKSYDRSTGYFGAEALALSMRGIEGLIRNGGKMRLVVGCTLSQEEVAAIEKGETLHAVVSRVLGARPLAPPDDVARDALELLAWMIEHGFLEVKVAVPCNDARKPMAVDGIFHEKSGIVTDSEKNRLAFTGSINETYNGWKNNWESFTVFTTWSGTSAYVDGEEANFARIWANKAKRVLTMDVPQAVRDDLLRFLPESDKPARLFPPEAPVTYGKVATPRGKVSQPEPIPPALDPRRQVWTIIHNAPRQPVGGERVGEATCPVEPWPHQIRAFQRLYGSEAPRLLIADEVGLGKTIQAGMLLRQMWLAGRARRILVLTPAAVMRQWQLELREKFNLNWPIYDDGRLVWYPSPALRGHHERVVDRQDWHREPFVIASSHLMRRKDREKELCEAAEPWDLIVLDEAHHARRRGAGSATEEGPNALLRLMRKLRDRTRGLVLLTATPMQVHPVELWDLLHLLGLPSAWNESAFLSFFEILGKPVPSAEEFEHIAGMFRAAEAEYGQVQPESLRELGVTSSLRGKKILKALRDSSKIPRNSMETSDRKVALSLMRRTTPVSSLVSRHTRDLLRRYHAAGKLDTPIATRKVVDEFIDMTPAERAVYDEVEAYISTTYNQASAQAKNAVGFVMTVYRRRLASSFRALRCTLEARLAPMVSAGAPVMPATIDNASDDESRDEVMDAEEAAALEHEALLQEEKSDIQAILRRVAALPVDTKAKKLGAMLAQLRSDGYPQAMVFTQFTDTMDFLRDYLSAASVAGANPPTILCFSGRGGEALTPGGSWQSISRDDVKKRFREGQADVLLCTDAAAEGLNFQFCGALVNYDMPWNPMRVEQRIGRIDRLGQRHGTVRIVNLHYRDTVESDVYLALRKRIGLFQSVVGRLQPILAELPRTIARTVLGGTSATAEERARIVSEMTNRVESAESQTSVDLDLLADADLDMPVRSTPPIDLAYLDSVVRRADLMPPGVDVEGLAKAEYAYLAPGMPHKIRVTTNAEYYEAHAESVELWSPGSPIFPDPVKLGLVDEDHDFVPALPEAVTYATHTLAASLAKPS
jgi:ERCC4-related helicase